ncbi:amidase [Actinokineospora diospyrosa]|uniref:Aspartyl-tRNA(Asn)/glutamyl-tRNA(Gln) amidotransferase subunit A n=1 Tax=Actinokineospora diospyrosa TaxID=103728 RepID=A0ABT1I661_9PSEU|nr:amidase [Actinokineospora diospyrosa]MCP2268123.1 aspartyl-tRNA(Asn)/glutamyl-tRNA(Gln) amidotransferase subunit A [Actinokineospora diospyrosa]
MDGADLCHKPATEVLALFQRRQLSPVELLDALIARAERLEPRLNAFATTYHERARVTARAAEARYQAGGDPARPLDGLPLVAKSDTDSAVEGTVSSDGCLWLTGAVDEHTSPTMARLLAAGAALHARTTMPELGWAWTCDSRAHGLTPNPWDPTYSSGGSSSGSAVAVVAGTTTVAMGTDCLGSLRVPSAMCGVVGFKPPYGRNPLHPGVSYDFFTHIGPMTRTVADAALLQNVTSGPHPLDHTSLPGRVTIPQRLADVRGLRIAFSLDLGCFPVTADVRRETLATLRALADAGARVEEVEVPWAGDITRAASRYTDRLYAEDFVRALREHPDEVSDYTGYYAQCALEVDPDELRRLHELAAWTWYHHFGPLFEQYDAFLCPTLAFHEVPAANRPWERTIEVNGTHHTDHDGVMTGLFNVYSRCPVLVVPSGQCAGSGLPTSVQIATRPYDDVTAFQVGAAIEQARPWPSWSEPASRPAHNPPDLIAIHHETITTPPQLAGAGLSRAGEQQP